MKHIENTFGTNNSFYLRPSDFCQIFSFIFVKQKLIHFNSNNKPRTFC